RAYRRGRRRPPAGRSRERLARDEDRVVVTEHGHVRPPRLRARRRGQAERPLEQPARVVGAGMQGEREAAAEARVDLDEREASVAAPEALQRERAGGVGQPRADDPAPLLDLRVAHGVALADLARAGLEPAAGNDAGGAAVGPDEDVERELDALDVLLQERLGHAPRVE